MTIENKLMELITFKIKFFSELSALPLYQIVKLRQDVFIIEQACLYSDIDNLDQKALHATLISEEDDQLVAYCRVLPAGLSYPEVSIGRVVVAENARQKGFASKLMKRVLHFIQQEMQAPIVRISAQSHLQPFYETFNFKTVSAPYDEDGIEHVEMLLTNDVQTFNAFNN